MKIKVRDRVMFEGVPATVVMRVDRLFVDIQLDEPIQRLNYAGMPYETTSLCAHVDLLEPLDGGRLW